MTPLTEAARTQGADLDAGKRDGPENAVALAHSIDPLIAEVRDSLKALQAEEGEWLFELEAGAAIPAEYIILGHFLDEIDEEVDSKLAAYLRNNQADHGGWPLFYGGDLDISATVKSYFALKLVGDDVDAPHMKAAREAILARGGAAKANVFTRITLAMFGQVPWRAVPVMPVEILLLPKSSPFHLSKVSYWSRTVIVPLLILMARKPKARNPRGVDIAELFVTPPEQERDYLKNATSSPIGELFLGLDRLLRAAEPLFPEKLRARAIKRAVDFIVERLNGEDGLGGIFPAMANTVMALDTLGYAKDHPHLTTAKSSVRKLLVLDGESGYCQPCLSPLWDTCLAAHALMEAGEPRNGKTLGKAAAWMANRQVLDVAGDWAARRPDVRPGGWAFQYRNDHYPDVDDAAVVVMALDRVGYPRYRKTIDRGAEWILGMQSKNGGWASFDADNNHTYLNHIPFADHGALLDPPTVDVTARCIGMLCQLGYGRDHLSIARGLEFLRREQEEDGSWYGRWGMNYVYGTWSALAAFNAAGENPGAPRIRKAVAYLKEHQREDGGWGEDGATYWPDKRGVAVESTPSQTSWALLALMAAVEVESDAVRRGVEYLVAAPRRGAKWKEPWYTAVGFPRVFYLRYHGYSIYFPLWALARYRNLMLGNDRTISHGI